MLCLVTLIFCVFNQPHHVTLAADSDLDNIHVAVSESSLQKMEVSVYLVVSWNSAENAIFIVEQL